MPKEVFPSPGSVTPNAPGRDPDLVSIRMSVYMILLLIGIGTHFGRIVATDNIPDRAVQEYRLRQIPKRLAERQKELRDKGEDESRIDRRLREMAVSLCREANRARPTLSANDRSRWLTLRALVEPDARLYRYLPLTEDGKELPIYSTQQVKKNCSCDCPQQFNEKNRTARQYVKQYVPFAIDKAMELPGWDTIDMVKHGRTGESYDPSDPASGYLYSSKPPLLPLVMAAPYWLLYHLTGLSLANNPYWTTRILLVLINLLPLFLAWYLLVRLIDEFGRSDWGRFFAVGALCFGTFLSTFVVTLNNHLPSVVSIVIMLYVTVQITYHQKKTYWNHFIAGLFGAFAVASDLPALAISGSICLFLLWRSPRKTFLVSLPAATFILVAFLWTNYLAHETFKPPYAKKRDHIELAMKENASLLSTQVLSFDPEDWYVYRYYPSGQAHLEKNARLSYWSNRIGIDRGEPSRSTYLFHMTLGHHGFFSLTPIWFLSLWGLLLLASGRYGRTAQLYALWTLGLTVLFFSFYLLRNQGDRNYGGMTCGLRWLFPLIPLWLPAMLPVLDRMNRNRCLQWVALVLLFFSCLSASYPIWNPWTSPWFYNLMVNRGWISGF